MYKQYERMSTREKDWRCDNHDKVLQKMTQHRRERERLFEYDLQQKNYGNDNTNRQPFKRQLTSTSRIDEYDANDYDSIQFIGKPNGPKRKQQRLNDKESNGKHDDVISAVEHSTPTSVSSYGGRLFINNKRRTNKNRHAKGRKKNENNNITSDDETAFDNRTAVHKTNIIENENPIDEQENEKDKNEEKNIIDDYIKETSAFSNKIQATVITYTRCFYLISEVGNTVK